MRLIFLNLLLILGAVSSVAGDIAAKTWTLNRKFLFFVVAMTAYFASTLIWMFFLRDLRLSVAIPWWQAMVAIPAILAGIIYFHEKLSWIEVVAIGLIVIGVIILNLRHT
jgi:multidrug transporter EmrE-like cation transporter